MLSADLHEILDFADHPDAGALAKHDHPRESLRRWRGVLTAKAWLGSKLACFFVESDGQGDRIVLLFHSGDDYRPALGGEDMRQAPIPAVYELDVFAIGEHLPIVDRTERVEQFT